MQTVATMRIHNMNKNAEIITLLCSHLCLSEGIKPLSFGEWQSFSEILKNNNQQPCDLANFRLKDFETNLGFSTKEAERFVRLIDRGGSMSFIISRYQNIGINIVTLADEDYPNKLREKLNKACPPLFYYIGQLLLLKQEAIGYVGSRNANQDDLNFTAKIIAKTASRGYAVVSGGAKGVDSAAALSAIKEGVPAIEFLADSMIRKSHNATLMKEIRNGHVLLMSVAVPDAGFNVGFAMMRNHYIYAHSTGTVVVRADTVGRGGTWTGANDNLKNKWCQTFCRNCNYLGNMELIKNGAIPIDENWDGNVNKIQNSRENEQPTLF